MLLDVADLYQKQKARTARKKSGDATEIVIRDYLISHDLNMALDKELTCKELSIRGYENQADRIDALLLKKEIDQHKIIYYPNEVDTVIEIKNTAASEQSNNIRRKFKILKNISSDLRFAVIVLSEKLLSPTPYANAIYEEDIAIEKCKVFTNVVRRQYYKLYEKDIVINKQEEGLLWKTGEWKDCIDYLKTN